MSHLGKSLVTFGRQTAIARLSVVPYRSLAQCQAISLCEENSLAKTGRSDDDGRVNCCKDAQEVFSTIVSPDQNRSQTLPKASNRCSGNRILSISRALHTFRQRAFQASTGNQKRAFSAFSAIPKSDRKVHPITVESVRFESDSGRALCAEWCGENRCNLNQPENAIPASVWEHADCCKDNLCETPFRHDAVYMPGSNKATRKYQQTWLEPGNIKIVATEVCCCDGLDLPYPCIRPRSVRPKTANPCSADGCIKLTGEKCQKTTMLCCRKARNPPKCSRGGPPSCCQKRCTPYPSFSECCRPLGIKPPPTECECLSHAICDVAALWRVVHRR